MSQHWFVRRGNQERGPLTLHELKQLVAKGTIVASDLLRTDEMLEWSEAGSVNGLFEPERTTTRVPPPLPQSSANPPLPTTPARNMPPLPPTASALLSSALWNPFVARLWSLLFTPAFGAFLMMQNWKTLGEEARAKRSMLWFYGFLALILLALITPDTKSLNSVVRLIGGVMILAWALTDPEKQIRFVKEKYGKDYQHKSWLKPVGYSLAIASAMVVVFAVFSLVAENIAPPDKTYQEMNTEITYSGSIPRETIGKFAQYLVETKFIDPARDGTQKKHIKLKTTGEKYEFWVVLKNKGQEQDPKVVAVIEQFARQLSRDVFSGAIVDNHLCDENWNVLRVVPGKK